MPGIRALRGIHYNLEKIEDIARVVTEPYDVISPLWQKAYYKIHPYNIIRLILGKGNPSDNSKNNQYTRAHKYFGDWLKRDILLRDKKESIYIYVQTFLHHNRRKTRTGFIVLLKLEDFGKNTILPHENTISCAVQDRLKLLKAVCANLSPIFALCSDPQRKINKLLSQYKRDHQAYIVLEKDKILHRVWRMSEKAKIRAIKRLIKGRQIFIADGHHRYEAALNYKMQMQGKKGRRQVGTACNYIMAYLVATPERGLTILPTHRAVRNIADFKPQEIIEKLGKFFQVRRFSRSDELFSYMRQNHAATCIFGAYFGKNKFYSLKLRNRKIVDKFIGKNRATLHKNLDVSILHSVIIERILNIPCLEENIYYSRDAQGDIKLVDEDKYQLALFLRPPTVTQVKRAAKTGKRMPHKSTYFYPKLLTGLVINKL